MEKKETIRICIFAALFDVIPSDEHIKVIGTCKDDFYFNMFEHDSCCLYVLVL